MIDLLLADPERAPSERRLGLSASSRAQAGGKKSSNEILLIAANFFYRFGAAHYGQIWDTTAAFDTTAGWRDRLRLEFPAPFTAG